MDSTSPLFDTLVKAGLEPTSAEVYITLIGLGEASVGAIEKQTPFSRATLYDALSTLLAAGYLEYRKEGRNAYYKPVHPQKLEELITQKKRETALLETELGEAIRTLTGSFNLTLNKPGVKFYEGKEGIRHVLWDSLTAHETIYTLGDLELFANHYNDLNSEYVEERKKRKIFKKAITNDTEFTRNFLKNYDTTFTETKLISHLPTKFHSTILEIYDDKISYTTYANNSLLGVIIQDKQIYSMNRSIFEFMWETLISEGKKHQAASNSNS